MGRVTEYEFTLPEILRDTQLVFCNFHCYTEVYFDGELIYSVKISDDISNISTPGGTWTNISLYRDDTGKTCKVVLIPVYDNYKPDVPDFMVGSLASVTGEEIEEIFPEFAVTVAIMVLGFIATVLGLVFRVKTDVGAKFIAVGTFAMSMSFWRFHYFDIMSLILGNRGVFVYYFSLTMLMLTMIPLLEVVKNDFSPKVAVVYDILGIAIAVCGAVQLVLQISGVMDLRETLILTHSAIIVSILLIFICIVYQFIKPLEGTKRSLNTAVFIVLGLGLDLIFYYLADGYSGLAFTLFAIALFVFIEGVRFISIYLEQKERFAEHEIIIAQNEAKLAESRFTAMMSQIRSHFIFNILNAISGMCKYDPEKADQTIVHFARFLRSNIDLMQNDELVHFNSALRHIEDYVALEQVRYGDHIQFETDIECDDFMLPPLVMQPLVENSIKHGLTPRTEGGTIILRTRQDKKNYYIVIEDDGIGYDSSIQPGEHSVGLRNIRFRLDHMVKGTLKIESIVDIGTKATIIIPKEETEK